MFVQNKTRRIARLVAPILLLALLLALFVFATGGLGENTSREGAKLTEQSIRRAAVQCYALEGAFAPSYDYLVEHYGLRTDETRYSVYYTYVGANLLPQITVIDNPA